MSEPVVYKPGDRVQTPAHGVGVVTGINRGRARGRPWREPHYSIQTPGVSYEVWYYESEIKRA